MRAAASSTFTRADGRLIRCRERLENRDRLEGRSCLAEAARDLALHRDIAIGQRARTAELDERVVAATHPREEEAQVRHVASPLPRNERAASRYSLTASSSASVSSSAIARFSCASPNEGAHLNRVTQEHDRFVATVRIAQEKAEIVQRLGEVRIDRDRFAVATLGTREIFAGLEDEAEVEQCARVARRSCEARLERGFRAREVARDHLRLRGHDSGIGRMGGGTVAFVFERDVVVTGVARRRGGGVTAADRERESDDRKLPRTTHVTPCADAWNSSMRRASAIRSAFARSGFPTSNPPHHGRRTRRRLAVPRC